MLGKPELTAIYAIITTRALLNGWSHFGNQIANRGIVT